MTWSTGPLIGFDTETTGIDPGRDRIVTAALVSRSGGTVSARTWLINPGVPIPPQATAVHGITTAEAMADGAEPAQALEEIAAALAMALAAGTPVVAFNATYDLTILEAELARHDLPTLAQRLGYPARPVIDPLVVDRAVDRYRKGKRTLADLCTHYGITPAASLHSAQADVEATLSVLDALVAAHPDLANLDVDQLHEWQQAAHRSWAANFNAYLTSRGRPAGVALTWPL